MNGEQNSNSVEGTLGMKFLVYRIQVVIVIVYCMLAENYYKLEIISKLNYVVNAL